MKLFPLFLLLLSTSILAKTQNEDRDIPYDEMNSVLKVSQQAKSAFIKYNMQVKINNKDITFNDLVISLRTKKQPETIITIDKNGLINLPVLPEKQAKQTKLHINQPKDSVSISFNIEIQAPKLKQNRYVDLFILLDDSNRFIKKMAGVASWFVPSMDRLTFTFNKPASVTINSKNKAKQYHTDDDNKISIKRKSSLMRENPWVIFSELPIDMAPAD